MLGKLLYDLICVDDSSSDSGSGTEGVLGGCERVLGGVMMGLRVLSVLDEAEVSAVEGDEGLDAGKERERGERDVVLQGLRREGVSVALGGCVEKFRRALEDEYGLKSGSGGGGERFESEEVSGVVALKGVESEASLGVASSSSSASGSPTSGPRRSERLRKEKEKEQRKEKEKEKEKLKEKDRGKKKKVQEEEEGDDLEQDTEDAILQDLRKMRDAIKGTLYSFISFVVINICSFLI
jgi:hypothetical protein